jgi:hypothetical protein
VNVVGSGAVDGDEGVKAGDDELVAPLPLHDAMRKSAANRDR